jgi:D-amino-acid dehydrogenase
LLGYGVRSVGDPESALYFEPRQLIRMLPWLIRFAARCNEADHTSGRIALGALAERSVLLLEEMAAEGIPIELRRAPLLVAARRPEQAEAFLARLGPVAQLGYRIPNRLLSRDEVMELEPALTDAAGAGLVIEPHCTVDPGAVVGGLRDHVVERGAEILEGTEVRDVDLEGGRVVALHTSSGRIRCESVVLAAGAWLGPLSRRFRLRAPIQAGKGYSFAVRPRVMPRHALLLLEPHVGCSPFGERLRIAGTMEFSGINGRVDGRRVESIMRGAGGMLGDWTDLDPDSIWSGLRPIAPDGLPIIDRHPTLTNVFLAGAYSMLGMTLAAPAAEALTSFLLTDERPSVLSPFQLSRFAGWGRRGRRGGPAD